MRKLPLSTTARAPGNSRHACGFRLCRGVVRSEQFVPARDVEHPFRQKLEAVQVMDFRDSRADSLVGRPQLLAALDEQGLADSLRLTFGPAFGPAFGLALGLSLAENALVDC